MSVFFNESLAELEPYVPGEQPRDMQYIKLNTNESPYFPSRYAVKKITGETLDRLRLYSDPECGELREAIAEYYGIDKSNVLPTNGSDEALAFCFAAYGGRGVAFPDVTYGFYKVFAALFGAEYEEIPLKPDFSIDAESYENIGKTVVLANPNAQTGVYLSLDKIERIVKSNGGNVVIIDEAYIDFGGESAIGLINKYDNLIVVQTFSKSRSLAGARVGFAVACKALIEDLVRVKFAFNPYNVNSLSAALAAEAMRDVGYFNECTKKISATRSAMTERLKKLGYAVLPSLANFVLAKSGKLGGKRLYEDLKSRGVLVRHFDDPRIEDYVRITVGTDEQTDELIKQISYLERSL